MPSPRPQGDAASARRVHARALLKLERYKEAAQSLTRAVADFPHDFASARLLRELHSQQLAEPDTEATAALETSLRAYQRVAGAATSAYTGFRPSANWTPRRMEQLPTVDEFEVHVERREPLIISAQGAPGLDGLLGWSTQRWTGDYLLQTAGDVKVVAERVARSTRVRALSPESDPVPVLGSAVTVRRERVEFRDFLQRAYLAEHDTDWVEYLNLEGGAKAHGEDGLHHGVLGALREDVPPPTFLAGITNGSFGHTLSKAHVWMSQVPASTSSRSHMAMDPEDSLYVLVRGRQRICIVAPSEATSLRTVSPTYHTAENGLSFRGGTDPEPQVGDHVGTLEDVERDEEVREKSVVELEAGDMLFLPTGWFHQVTSVGGQHLAINYWWRPPGWQNMTRQEVTAKKALLGSLGLLESQQEPERGHGSEL